MNRKRKEEFLKYIQTAITQTEFRLRGNIVDNKGNLFPKRNAFVIFRKYIKDFVEKGIEPRWVVMPGLRGVGKTTLMAQLFFLNFAQKNVYKFYLSVDEIVRRFSASLWDVIEVYEEVLGKRIEQLDHKLILFFDEVQYDSQWDSAIKSLYDRSKNVFVLCTGSSSILLKKQISSDSARRAYFEELYPMSFTEYVKLRYNKYPEKSLASKIKEAILESNNADEVFRKLTILKNFVSRYWLKVDALEIQQFLKFGTLPFSLVIKEEAVILNQLEQILQKIIYTDIPQLTNFDKETLNKIYALVYMISDSFEVSLTNLSSVLEISKDTLSLVLSALENADFLYKVAPYGSHYKQVRKPYKYLFATPAFRYLLLSSKESISVFDNFKGKLLEDVVGLYLRRILQGYRNISLTYDSSKEGADFIIKKDGKKIIIEVGFGYKGIKQVEYTLKRIKGDYGLVISESDKLEIKENIVKLPLYYFLLM